MTSKHNPLHIPAIPFPVKGNEIHIGDIPLSQLVSRAGQTPFYVYDRQAMTRKVQTLRQSLPARVHLHYAMKANPMPAVVQHMSHLTDGLDVASGGELRVALDTGTAPKDISFAGPGKQDWELRAAIEAGVIINMESAGEMQRIARLCSELHTTAKVAIRVNPDFELKGSGMKMGGGAKPFGIDAEQVPAVLDQLHQFSQLRFQGFHLFWGSQNLNPDSIIEAQQKTFALARSLAAHVKGQVQWLNIGGGLGIPYFPGERALELSAIADNLNQLLTEYHEFQETEIVMELGRYLVAEAGLYVCEVVDKKQSRGETFLVANGGMHHHLAVSGNFGQIIRKNYPVCLGNKVTSATTELVSVVGPLCTPLDILANKVELPVAEPGDLFVVFQSGAYGYTASPQRFLGHGAPVELLI